MTCSASDQRPNVLMIIVDDLAPVGTSFGGPVSLPSLEALAQRGISFNNNYANVPVCGASRASMMSGLAPTSTRFLTFDSQLDQDAPGTPSLPAFFREQGWHTAASGKIFDVIADSQDSWSEPVWSPESQWHGKKPDHRGEHLQAAYLEPFTSNRFPYAEKLAVEDDAYPDGQVASKAIADLQRLAKRDEPFFLAVGFRKPHLPFNAPDRYWVEESSVDSLPPTWGQTDTNVPLEFAGHPSLELRMQYDALPLFGEPDAAEAADIVAAYHAAARYADAQVGRVLLALQESDAANQTIVVVMGDHGFMLGHYQMWTKHALFEPALRTPLIIADPRLSGSASVSAVTDLLDVYPTLVDLAGLQLPDHLDGKTLRPLLENPSLTERTDKTASISRWLNGESVRDHQYRYTRWFDEDNNTLAEMLFDLWNDPIETNNLAGELLVSDKVEQLRDQLLENRQGPVWSEALDAMVSQMKLITSPAGNIIIAAIAYPMIAGLIALALLGGIAWLTWLGLRSRSR
ncbi:sulfatase [Halioglobus maricola]|nr:sulfatase [Halioglobus maricola]